MSPIRTEIRLLSTGLLDALPPMVVTTTISQGQRGLPGPPGPSGDAGGAFLVVNRFNEMATDEVAKAQARENLGLQHIDGGTFN